MYRTYCSNLQFIPDETYMLESNEECNEILPYHNELSKDVEDAKQLLLNLQNLVRSTSRVI